MIRALATPQPVVALAGASVSDGTALDVVAFADLPCAMVTATDDGGARAHARILVARRKKLTVAVTPAG